MSTTHRLTLPLSEAAVRALKVDDLVILDGEIVITAGLPTHERIAEYVAEGKPLPTDLNGQAFFHLGSYSRDGAEGFEVLYMNPTTSTRFNRFMPGFIRHFGLRAVGGKGGLDEESARAMQDTGCVYLAFLGGGAPLISAAIRQIVSVSWDDLVSHYRLVRLRVEALGPLVVAIDAHGNNKYLSLRADAGARLENIMDELNAGRAAAQGGSGHG